MAKYRVNEKGPGYINDRMEQPQAVFTAKDGLTGSWFDEIEADPPVEVAAEPVAQTEPQPVETGAQAQEDAAAGATRPDPALAEAEIAAAAGASEGMNVETL